MTTPHGCVLEVNYQGPATIMRLLEAHGFEREYVPFDNDSCPIKVTESVRVPVVCVVSLEPEMSREYGKVFRSTPHILEQLTAHNLRGLNVPELIELGHRFPDFNFVGFGQPIPTEWGRYVPYVIRRSISRLPYDRSWGPTWTIPATPLH